jgi:uncharacterized protein (DUF362 family)
MSIVFANRWDNETSVSGNRVNRYEMGTALTFGIPMILIRTMTPNLKAEGESIMSQKPHRRDFLKRGLLAAAAVASAGPASLFASRVSFAEALPDLAIAHGRDPAQNTKTAVDALGGMKRFVKPGNKVVIKPNMSFDGGPAAGCTTNPAVVAEVARLAADAGAASIAILDNVLRNPEDCLSRSKILEFCQKVPNTVVRAVKAERMFKTVNVPQGAELKSMAVVSEVLDADVLIAVPVGKSHSSSGVSFSMKGMMGLIQDRHSFHSRYDLHTAIVDMVTVLKPHLVVIDGTRILSAGGPSGPGDVISLNVVIASPDMVAADAQMLALGTWYGRQFSPNQVKHIKLAAERGLGTMDLGKLNVKNFQV